MNDTKTYLTRMIIFLAVVGAGSAFVAPQLVNIFVVNPVLNGIIFGVIVTGIVLNFRQVLSIAPEASLPTTRIGRSSGDCGAAKAKKRWTIHRPP